MTNESLLIGDGLHVEFPFVPYDCQISFMKNVVEALNLGVNAALESPTGTGKTLSLLCASLAWVQREKERLKPKIQMDISGLKGGIDPTARGESSSNISLYPKILYASRTHSQLQQIVRELNKTKYRSVIKVATLAGRDQLCINEKVMHEKSAEKKGHMCRSLVNKRGCHYYNTLDKDSDLVEEMYKSQCGDYVMDIEDLITTARKLRHCPYYRSKQMHETADLILLPYTYILDPKTRDAYKINLRGNILIFDEAHNLESVAEESMSIDFSTKALSLCIRECKKVLELLMEEEEAIRTENDNSTVSFATLMHTKESRESRKEQEKKLKQADVAQLLSFLQTFDENIDAMNLSNEGAEVGKLPGRLFVGQKIISLLESAGIGRLHREPICRVIDHIGVFLAQKADNNQGIWAETGSNLAEFSNFLAKVLADTCEGFQVNTQEWLGKMPLQPQSASRHFQLYVVKDEGGAMKFHYWCFSAGVAMRFLQSRGVRSMILASGTLSPIQHFLSTMSIPFHCVLENGHAAKQDQLVVGTLRKGPGGCDIVGTFQKRNDAFYKSSMGEILLQTAKVTPQGLLVFFPSYSQMTGFVEHWKLPRSGDGLILWSLLEKYKRIFVEPKDKTDVKPTFRDFDAAIREGHSNGIGAMFLAVCRGKLSEGIDFADSHCRAVVVVGIPFPPLFDPRIILKKAFLADLRKQDSTAMNPEEWYKIEGIRAVNQALGRIIRHKDDFGVVVLADARYSTMDRNMFPSWVRSVVKVHDGPRNLFVEIERFFVERGLLVEQSHTRLQNDYDQRATLSAKRRRVRQKQGDADGDNETENRKRTQKGVSELDAIAEIYGFSSQNTTEIEADNVREKLGASSSTGALDKFLNILNTIPDSQKLYPKKIELPVDARQRALDAVSSSTRRDMNSISDAVQPAKKKIKLKANTNIAGRLKNDAVVNGKLSSWVVNKGQTGQDFQRRRNATVEIIELDNDPCTKESALITATSEKSGSETKEANLMPRKVLLCKPKQMTMASVSRTTNMNGNAISCSSSSILSTSDGFAAKDELRPKLTQNLAMRNKPKAKDEINDELKNPPIFSAVEYRDLMGTLDLIARNNLLKAQKAYIRERNFDSLIDQLGHIALPNHPLVFSGFYDFINDDNHRRRFRKLCNDYNLLK